MSPFQLELDIFKRINVVSHIRRNRETLPEICLTLEVDFWFSTPGLALVYPIRLPRLWVITGKRAWHKGLRVLIVHWFFLPSQTVNERPSSLPGSPLLEGSRCSIKS